MDPLTQGAVGAALPLTAWTESQHFLLCANDGSSFVEADDAVSIACSADPRATMRRSKVNEML